MTRKHAVLEAAFVVLAIGLGYAARALAAGPPTTNGLTYAGVLEDASGPISANHNIQVLFYDAAMAGNTLCQSTAAAIAVADGHFSVPLPDGCATATSANPNVWVDVLVDGADTGRTKLGVVPYALEAAHAVSATTAMSATSATSATTASAVAWSGVTGIPASVSAIGNGALAFTAGGFTAVGGATSHDPHTLPTNDAFIGHIGSPDGFDVTGMCANGINSAATMCTGTSGGSIGDFWYWAHADTATTMTTLMNLSASTGTLRVSGPITFSGGMSVTSTAAAKKDIHFLNDRELDQVLRTVESTPVATYRYKTGADDSKVLYGVIAENTPSLLLSDDSKMFSFTNAVGALLASVKAQQAQITKLQAQLANVDGLDARLRLLESRCAH
jgi:hypothetical protein